MDEVVMIFDASDFSRFEVCPRLPQLRRTFEPPQWPIREATKMFFERGVRAISAGDSVDVVVGQFLTAAARPGFTYPEGDHYILAQDHAAWLDGALRIVAEENSVLEPMDLFQVGPYRIHVEGFSGKIFRVSSRLGERNVRWPELVAMAFGREVEITVFRLPSVRGGRVLSPLVMAYQHPRFENINYRIARLYDDEEFNAKWKRVGRWEIQPVPDWSEWRLGIERDKALPLVREKYTVFPTLDTRERDRLLFDIEAICNAQESPTIYPRFREKCPQCVFSSLCHGNEQSRAEYQVLGKEELARFEEKLKRKML